MCHSAFQSHWGQTRQVMGDVKAKYLRKILVDSAKEITPYLHPLLTPPRIGGSHNSSPHKSLIPSKLQKGPKENPRILQFFFFLTVVPLQALAGMMAGSGCINGKGKIISQAGFLFLDTRDPRALKLGPGSSAQAHSCLLRLESPQGRGRNVSLQQGI